MSVAAAALSAAKSGLAIAIRYGATRRQFGPAGMDLSPVVLILGLYFLRVLLLRDILPAFL